ncbi:MAG: amidohydrolase family protein [Lachnospiraceae bacterium]|nr:amidohydrolase family protein [Lachnospiraceae bacterium]
MNSKIELLHGDIVYSESRDSLTVRENAILAVEDGRVRGIYAPDALPEEFRPLPVTDYGRSLIIPGFTDMHVHAPQYEERGIRMDLLLSDWLNQCTFPEEAKFADHDYARMVYRQFAQDLVRQGTLHAVIFATLHAGATDILMDLLEEQGIDAFVGKVNMDINSPAFLCETAEESLRETEAWLERHSGAERRVRPILTPRFAPTCSFPLLQGLGALAKKYHAGVQTHLVESKWEAAESVSMYPECGSDAGIYERAGLLGEGPSIFAHVIFPTAEDLRIMQKYGSFAVHCPDATTNIIAGIAPVAAEQAEGIRVALGSDVGAGHSLAVYRQAARAVQLSKLKEFYEPAVSGTISFANAFYMATKEGGSLFGKTGSFEKGYDFDALVINGQEDAGLPLDAAERLERFCYTGDDRDIAAWYMRGKKM